MIEPKPLSKETLGCLHKYSRHPGFNATYIDELVAAEMYWRQEAEKWRKIVAGMIHDTVEGYCQFCGHYVVRYTEDHNSNRQVVPHKSNCPAVLAQDFV